jgi:hypothetical protein
LRRFERTTRRIALAPLALIRSVTQRSDERRNGPWNACYHAQAA